MERDRSLGSSHEDNDEDNDQAPLVQNEGTIVIDILGQSSNSEANEEVPHDLNSNNVPGPLANLSVFTNEAPPDATKITLTVKFAIFLLFAYLIGCIIIAALAIRNPESFLIGSIISLLPTFILIYIFYWRNHKHKASLHLFAKLFLYAFFGALGAALVEVVVDIVGLIIVSPLVPVIGSFTIIIFAIFSAFVVAAGVEEAFKYLVINRMLSQSRPTIWHPRSCLIYGMAVALGFATIENIMYVLVESLTMSNSKETGLDTTTSTLVVGVLRGLLAVPMHMLCGMWIGHGFSRRVFKGENLSAWKVLKIPILIHGSYDAVLLVGVQLGEIGVAVGGVLAIVIMIVSFRHFMKKVWPESESAVRMMSPVLESINMTNISDTI